MLVTSSADLMLWERIGVLVGTLLGEVNASSTEITRCVSDDLGNPQTMVGS